MRSLSNISLQSLDLIFTILIYEDIGKVSREALQQSDGNLIVDIDEWKTNYDYGNKFASAAAAKSVVDATNGNSHFQLLVEASQTITIQQLHQIFMFEACGMVKIDNKLLGTVGESRKT